MVEKGKNEKKKKKETKMKEEEKGKGKANKTGRKRLDEHRTAEKEDK